MATQVYRDLKQLITNGSSAFQESKGEGNLSTYIGSELGLKKADQI
jgi:hypothetical protein